MGPGDRLGGYEALAHLGSGGMGEVYRARDAKLGREVAIKVLRPELAADPDHLARFEREARLLAALNHPNVAAIYGLEEAGGVRFLVLEHVPGETLAERIRLGALGLDETLLIGRQVAAALGAAHARGIVHRDLKPLNIKVTPEGVVKVLDFGIAKALDPGAGPLGAATTLTTPSTLPGALLGTPAAMSPEQVRGLPVDARSDLWSLGCVLYEMLAGRGPFVAATVADTFAAILGHEPDWQALPAGTPAALTALIRRCLEKDREARPADAETVRRELEAISGATAGATATAVSASRLSRSPSRLLAAVRGLLTARPQDTRQTPVAGAPAARLVQVTFGEGIEEFPAFSPDGRELVYAGEVSGVRRLFRKRLPDGEPVAVTAGRFDDIQPAFSRDGRSVLFVRAREAGRKLEPRDVFGQHDDGDLWSVDLAGGAETRIAEKAFNPDVSPDGRQIAVDASWAGPRRIWLLDGNGRNPRQASTDTSEEVAHVRPRWSPDGARLVFQNLERTRFDIRVVEVGSGRLSWLTNDLFQDLNPVWSRSGRFVYFSSNRGGGLNVWRAPVAPDGSPAGAPQQVTTGAGQDIELALSPDGRRLALAILRQNADLWRLPVDPSTGLPTGAPEKVIATSREESRGSWSPDGGAIAFNSDRAGEMNVWLHSLADGSTRQLTRGPGGDYQPTWSPDGRTLAFFSSRGGRPGVWTVEVEAGRMRRLSPEGPIEVNPFFSPDGSVIAFQSDRDGRLEVWVMGADGSRPRQLTRVGVMGHFLRWSADARSVIFRSPGGGSPRTMRVPLDGGEPEPTAEVAGGAHMSLSPDGSRIMDVVGHKVLWVSPLGGGRPERVFAFDDPDVRIDYPVWSPDGRWVLFDRFRPQGGDVWLMEGLE
ncbi:MAG TPA: protein kinase [Thermoanaerobaculaceae bacterium]|nr:protein kinase [Thermoanaerobaculaceae bacterium]